AEEVGHVAHDAANFLGAVVDRVAAHRRLAPGRVEQRGEDAHGGRLAGAVGSDEPVDVALLQLQRQPVEGVQVAVHLRQIARLDHGPPAVGSREVSTTTVSYVRSGRLACARRLPFPNGGRVGRVFETHRGPPWLPVGPEASTPPTCEAASGMVFRTPAGTGRTPRTGFPASGRSARPGRSRL